MANAQPLIGISLKRLGSIYTLDRYVEIDHIPSPQQKSLEHFQFIRTAIILLSMKVNDLILRGYAEQDDDGSWFAICLDLNLYARGESFEEVRGKLRKMTACYLKEAVEKDSQYFADLVPRKAPVNFWLRYYVIRLLVGMHHRSASKQDFKMPLPLVPAF